MARLAQLPCEILLNITAVPQLNLSPSANSQLLKKEKSPRIVSVTICTTERVKHQLSDSKEANAGPVQPQVHLQPGGSCWDQPGTGVRRPRVGHCSGGASSLRQCRGCWRHSGARAAAPPAWLSSLGRAARTFWRQPRINVL